MNSSDGQLLQTLQMLDPTARTALQELVAAGNASRERRQALLTARRRKYGLIQMRGRMIILRVAAAFGVSATEVTRQSRERQIVLARHAAMYLMRQHLGWSCTRIAKARGRRNHTTVLHAWQMVERLLQADEVFRNMVLAVSAKCRKLFGQNGADPIAVMHGEEALQTMRAL